MPLTEAQWAAIPVAPCPLLGLALPAAQAASAEQARQVVWRLPPEDARRLRTFALCVSRLQRLEAHERDPRWPLYLPPAAEQRILACFDA